MQYKSNYNVVYSCKYHIFWCPKYRCKVLVQEIAARLRKLISSMCQDFSADIIELEIMPDHVHLLVSED